MRPLESNQQPTTAAATTPALHSRLGSLGLLWNATWLIAIPAIVTLLMMRYLLPSSAQSEGTLLGLVARAALANPLIFAVGLFLILSLITRYWRYYLPGFRVTYPVVPGTYRALRIDELRLIDQATVLVRRLTRPRAQRRRNNTLTAAANAAVQISIRELSEHVANGRLDGIRSLMGDLESYDKSSVRYYEFSDWLRALAFAGVPILMALGFRAQAVQTCKVSGSSMLPTLADGDSLGLRPSAYRTLSQSVVSTASQRVPARGDIVVFDNSQRTPEDYLIKRVIGLPGDEISMKGGLPVINGWTVPYCDAGIYANVTGDLEPTVGHVVVEFLEDRAYLTLYTTKGTVPSFEAYQVKEHEVFVLGDNRFASSDSRSWNDGRGGGVPIATIRGRADWFLTGITREGTLDFSRLLEPFNLQFHLEGVDVSGVKRRIQECVRNKPALTSPPPPKQPA